MNTDAMAVEIERKFLVKNGSWKAHVSETIEIKQGYLNSDMNRTVRVRIQNKLAMLTIKGKSQGISRMEFEYEIPISEAEKLIGICEPGVIEKTRHIIRQNEVQWEVDVFAGENAGLTLAEIELDSEEQEFDMPEWLGTEVSTDARYFNSSLAKLPFSKWNRV